MLGVFKAFKTNVVVWVNVEPIPRDSKYQECKYLLNLSAIDGFDDFKTTSDTKNAITEQ